MSSVAPRGSCGAGASLIVSVELFRFRESFTVAALLVETTLACFPCVTITPGLLFPLTVPEGSLEVVDTERTEGAPDGCLEIARLGAVGDVDAVERTDIEDTVRFVAGLAFESTGEGAGRFLAGVVGFDAVDGARDRGNLDAEVAVVREVPVVFTLKLDTAEAVEPRRLRAVTGVMSVFAVSNAVDTSLVVFDMVEGGRPERADVGLRDDGLAGERLRIVDVCDLTEATLERSLDPRSPGDRLPDTLRRPGTGDRLARPEA